MSGETWLAVAAVGIATYLARASFVVAADRVRLPALARRSLRFIPLAALPAIAAPAIVRVEEPSALVARLAAAAVACLVAWRTRSLPVTLLAGLVALVVLQLAGARVG